MMGRTWFRKLPSDQRSTRTSVEVIDRLRIGHGRKGVANAVALNDENKSFVDTLLLLNIFFVASRDACFLDLFYWTYHEKIIV